MKTKVALFDFDKTIIAQDSIFLLYRKTVKEHKDFRDQLYKKMFRLISRVPGNPNWKKDIKTEFLQMLHYYSDEDLYQFVAKDLMEEMIFQDAKEEILHLKEEGYYLILVSASVEKYLKYVGDFLPFDHIIGTETNENYEVVGKNNKQKAKVERIEAFLKEKNLAIDYENSRGYSDSLSADGPMLEIVKNRYLINAKRAPKGYKILEWK
ncbi:HAD-IB family hydrolase [Peptoniphilus sp. KCTC 25270]|uniref:HAD family hydrolase n=1 Tax=Peptoniphilus sp. KCTC 25270 TaxID=2897414 RepID=UPI001E2E276C|nr:HAD-IB family hydrolase [Peptoniphilus sp. KCTC 25270]MCD1147810.1 HAD-IB family hydrolase [Peptoniphilus sp. KCTC 25270]